MTSIYVYCKFCEHQKDLNDCWCVIDTKTKSRTYECKVKCIQPKQTPVLSKEESGVREPEPVQRDILDWSEFYAKESFFTQIVNWFRSPSGYTKVKTS